MTFVCTLAAMGAAAVAALRTTTNSGGVACGNAYQLTAGGTVNWTAAPWSVTTSTGPISSYPGQTQTNDCATIYFATVDLTGTNISVANLNITATSGAPELRVGSAGTLNVTGTFSNLTGISSTQVGAVRIDSGGQLNVPTGILNVGNFGELFVNGGTLSVFGTGEVFVDNGGQMLVGAFGGGTPGGTIVTSNNGIKVRPGGAAAIYQGTVSGGGVLTIGDASTIGPASSLSIGYPGPVTIDGSTIEVVQNGGLGILWAPAGPTALANGSQINVRTSGQLGFSSAFPNGVLSAGTGSGAVNVDPGGFINALLPGVHTIAVPVFNAGTIDVGSSSGASALHLFGGGSYSNLVRTYFSSDSVTFDGVSVMGSGQMSGPGTLVNTGTFDWEAGTISGPGTFINDNEVYITAGAVTLDNRTLANNGALYWGGTANINLANGAVLDNASGGLMSVIGDASMILAGGAATFNNAGVFQKNGPTGTTAIGVPVTNSGSLDIFTGIVDIAAPYTQPAASNLSMLLGGTTPGTQHGQLVVRPNPSLGGNLGVGFAPSYTPNPGDAFQVLSVPDGTCCTGNFATRSYPTLPPGQVWTETFDAAGLRLQVNQTVSDLSVTKTASATTVPTGGSLIYSISVANNGPDDAPNVTVTDTLPPGTTLVSVTATPPIWSCSGTSTITCTVSGMAASSFSGIDIEVTAPATPGTITNTVTVTSASSDPVPGNNSSSVAVDVVATSTSAVVTNLNDSGPGSLRNALELAAAGICVPCDITFNVTPSPGPIPVLSPLPYPSTTLRIDARTQPGYSGVPLIGVDGSMCAGCDGLGVQGLNSLVAGLAIYNFGSGGLWLEGSGGHTARDNWVGVDLAGNPSPNGMGIVLDNSGNTTVTNNKIAFNTYGVAIFATSSGNTITNNLIQNNGLKGVVIDAGFPPSIGNVILSNSFAGNGIGIDLDSDGPTANDANDPDNGANNLQNTPVISSATLSGGVLSAVVSVDSALANSQGIKVQLFKADASGQGQTLLGEQCFPTNVVTNQTMTVPAGSLVGGDLIVGTATGWVSTDCSTVRGDGTSEFGNAIAAVCTPPAVTLTLPPSMCAGTTGTASATPITGATYSWTVTNGTLQSGNGTPSITFIAGSTGSVGVSVTVTNDCGQSTTQSGSVPIGAASATITASGPTTFCQGGSVTLTANSGTSYLWSNGETTQSIVVTGGGNYTVTVSQPGGCVATSSPVTVTVLPAPAASISGPTAYCAGYPPITLAVNGSGISGVMWSTGETTNSITVNPSATTTYTATVTGTNGCTKVLNHTVTVGMGGPPLTVNAPASVTPLSTGNVASVASPPAGTYTWVVINGTLTSGQGTPSITFTAGESGNVQLLVTLETGGCAANGGVYVPITACSTMPPSLLSPANGASVSSPVAFSWSSVPNAVGYDVWRLTPGGLPAFVGSRDGSTTNLTAAVPAGTFDWYVEAKFASVCDPSRTASPTRRVTVLPAANCPSAAPSIIRPTDGSLFSPITFEWTAVDNAIGYRVMASLDGLPPTEIGATEPGDTELVATVPVGAVSWWVEAEYGGCTPVPSGRASFSVELEECFKHERPALDSPGNGTIMDTSAVTFSWHFVNGADAYAVWVRSGGEEKVVGTTLGDLMLEAVLDPATYDWWVEAKFEGCPSTYSDERRLEIPLSSSCPSAGPSLIEPANNLTVDSPVVTFAWSVVPNAITYELWLSLASGTESRIATTASTSLTVEIPEGESVWFVRARVNRCGNRESSRRVVRYVPPAACNTIAPHLLLPLEDGRPISSPATFSWTAVPGATQYQLFLVRGNSEQLLRTTTEPLAENVVVPNGDSRWYVKGLFASCPETTSSTGRFVAVPRPQACLDLPAPVLSVPGQMSSDTSFTVGWPGVPGAEHYLLTESFGEQSRTIQVDKEFETLTYPNETGEPITYVYRVQAVDTHCSPPRRGSLSDALSVTILPVRASESSAVIGSRTIVEQIIPIGPEFAGQSFAATSPEPWVTIHPSSGVVPAGGIDLVVTADVTGLPLGTSIASVTVTFGSGAGRLTTTSNHTKSTTVSVNLVTPVTPTPKSAPPPDALIIPAVAHAQGVNALFRSDVRVSNTAPQAMKYQVTFVPTGGTGMTQGRQTTLEIQPGRTVALDDILRTWFGTGSENVLGTLEIRPLTQSSSSTSSSAVRGVPNFVTFASSRTFNQTDNGTFGTYIAAIPFANFIAGATAGSPSGGTLSLQQISQSAIYRSNLGFVEGTGNPVSLLVSVFNGSGARVDQFPVDLNGGEHLQMGAFLHQRGIQLEDGRVEVKVASGSGKVTAYAAVVNNATGDSLVVTPTALGGPGSTKFVLPGVAELSGGVMWQTDARLFNAGSEPLTVTLRLHSLNNTPPQQTTLDVAPGQIRQLDRVLQTLFGITNDGGALHIETGSNANLIATARTYRPAGDGANFGQFIQAVTPDEAVGVGSRPLQILQVEESPRFRSNIGLAEVTGNPATVELTIIPPDSKVSARLQVDMAPNQFRQLNSLLAAMGLTGTHNARVTVKVIGGQGRVTAYAATIDAITQDPTFIPAQ